MAKFEKLENNEVKFEITVDAQTFDQGLQTAYKKHAKRYNVPGFRKGKAPRKMIEKLFGEGTFYEDAFDEVYWDPYAAAVKEADVVPMDSPRVTIEEIGEGKPLQFSAIVFVKPEIIIDPKSYRGLAAEKAEYPVEDAQVDAEINAQRERLARYTEVDRPIKNGDFITLDYSGSVDGVKFDGGTAQNQQLEIGSNQFIPGFEEQLIGFVKDQEGDIKVSFPEDYHAKELAGKEAVFTVKINDIKEKELPELDDEFAKDVSDFDTLEAFRADILAKMQTYTTERANNEMKNDLMSKLVEANEFPVPPPMIDRQVDRSVDDMSYRMRQQGLTLENYLSYTGMNMEQFREQMRPDAEKRVRADLILEQIIKNEKIEAEQAELDAEVEKLAKSIAKSLEETQKLLSERDFDSLKRDITMGKAIDFVLDQAKITKAKPAAKKKAPAKKKAEVSEDEADEKPKKTTRKKAVKSDDDTKSEV